MEGLLAELYQLLGSLLTLDLSLLGVPYKVDFFQPLNQLHRLIAWTGGGHDVDHLVHETHEQIALLGLKEVDLLKVIILWKGHPS